MLLLGGNLSAASLIQHWAFAADIFASKVSSEFSTLFLRSLDARFGDLTPTTHRSVTEQVQDAVALEPAASQEVPELIAA